MPDGTYSQLSNAAGSLSAFFKWAPKVTRDVDTKTSTLDFDGRTYPLAYFGERIGESQGLEFLIDTTVDGDQWANLQALIALREVLTWTDNLGNIPIHVIVEAPNLEDLVNPGHPMQRVRLKLTRVE